MQHLEEGLIHAWLDGALPADEAARVDAHAASCTDCGALVAEARGLIAASSRIISSLDVTPGGVLPAFGANPRRRWTITPALMAIAATVVVGVGGYFTMRGSDRAGSALQHLEVPGRMPPAATVPVSAPITVPSSAEIAKAPNDRRTQQLADKAAPPPAISARPKPEPAAPARVQLSEVVVTGTSAGAELLARVDSGRRDSLSLGSADRLANLAADSSRGKMAVNVATTGAAMGAGVGAQRLPAPMARAATTFDRAAPTDAVSARVFTGCYELNESTDVLPTRFALVTDAAPTLPGQFAVRYVRDGRPADPIQDVGWVAGNGTAFISTAGRGRVLSIFRSDSVATGQSPSGPRNGRVTPCR